MLQPLDEGKLEVLVPDGGNAGCCHIERARDSLEKHRDLLMGLYNLLNGWEVFQPRWHNAPEEVENADEKWFLYFYASPFRTLRLKPGADGTINIYSGKKFLKSFNHNFDRPQVWQAILRWIWKYGHGRQKARSIPELNPQRLRALSERGENNYGDDKSLYGLMHSALHLLEMKCLSKGVFKMLLAFDFCEPQLSLDRTSNFQEETGYERWQISLQNPPFSSLRVNFGTTDGSVDVYAPNKRPRSFQMTDGPPSWQNFLKFIWDYGDRENIDGKSFQAIPNSLKSRTKPQSKPQRVEKSLLHQVLRTAGFKAAHETVTKSGRLTSTSEEIGATLNAVNVTSPRGLKTKDPG